MRLKLPLFFIVFCCLFQFSEAQKWCQPGATWYYQEGDIVSTTPTVIRTGYDKEQYIKDTLIAGQSCKVLIDTSYNEGSAGIRANGERYTYASHDTVYILTNNTFLPYFYFGCHTGDTLMVPCGNIFVATHVDSTGVAVINGDSLRFYDYRAIDSTYACERQLAGASSSNGRVIERVGNLNVDPGNDCFSFDFSCLEYDEGYNLHCYQDDSFGLYSFDSTSSCTYITTGINEIQNSIGLNLFPNPTSNYCHLKIDGLNEKCSGVLYDMTGREIMELFNGQVVADFEFNTNSLSGGLYFVKIKSESGRTGVSKLSKE